MDTRRKAARNALDALEQLVRFRLHNSPYEDTIELVLQVMRPGLRNIASGSECPVAWSRRVHEANPGGLFSVPQQLHVLLPGPGGFDLRPAMVANGGPYQTERRLFELALAYPASSHPELPKLTKAIDTLSAG